jgi:hypothetical protein
VSKAEKPPERAVANAMSTPSSAISTHSILKEYDMAVVQDAVQLRNYVTNKLIHESDNMDARIRIRALELLGKITDVGLFTERSEVTVTNKSTIELETTLKEKLKKLMGTDTAEDAKEIDVINNLSYKARPISIEQVFSSL